jgi:CubicO group peptidase (beta-lactamase class C family)
LHDTGCLDTGQLIPQLAHGYDPGPGPTRLRPAPHYEWTNTTAAGGLYSTASDLVRWGGAVLERKWLSERGWDVMLQDHGDGRGYGVGLYTRHGHEVIGHDGVTNGYTAFVEIYPGQETVVAYAGNIRAGAFSVVQSASTAIALGEPPETVAVPTDEDRAVSPSEAQPLLGQYELFPGFHLDISYRGDRLYLSGTGGYPTVLSSLPGGLYFYRSMYADIRFEPDGDPPVLVWIDRRGQEYQATKVKN